MESTSLLEYTRGVVAKMVGAAKLMHKAIRLCESGQSGLSVDEVASRVDTSAAPGVLSAGQASPTQDGRSHPE